MTFHKLEISMYKYCKAGSVQDVTIYVYHTFLVL